MYLQPLMRCWKSLGTLNLFNYTDAIPSQLNYEIIEDTGRTKTLIVTNLSQVQGIFGDQLLGLEDNEATAVKINPNFVSTLLNIELTNLLFTQVILYDISGRLVYHFKLAPSNIFRISLENVPNGMYFLEVKNQAGARVVEKAVKN